MRNQEKSKSKHGEGPVGKKYTIWTLYREILYIPTIFETTKSFEERMKYHLEDLIRDVAEENFWRARVYYSLKSHLEQQLYLGCSNFTRLLETLKLFSLKARNEWTNRSFTELSEFLKNMLPEHNMLPNCNYEAKKILCLMSLEYKKIHVYSNDCVLYRDEFVALRLCPSWGISWFRKSWSN